MPFMTDRKRAMGLGSSKSGTEHHWSMTLSSVGLLILVPLFVFTFGPALGLPYEEMVLYYSDPQDAMSSLPLVLDLRDGMLVEAPPSDPQLLRNGTAKAEGGTQHYEMAYLSDYWIEDA